jgi:hypothetical protein
MVAAIADMIAALSRVCTLEPGDLIANGTPVGVGVFSGRLLRPGQRVRVEIEGISAIDNPVVAEPSPTRPAGLRSRATLCASSAGINGLVSRRQYRRPCRHVSQRARILVGRSVMVGSMPQAFGSFGRVALGHVR